MDHNALKQIIEALIVASDTPVATAKIADIIEELTPGQVRKIIDELNAEYTKSKRAFFIAQIGGGYQINTVAEYSPWLKKLFKGKVRPRLSQAGLESLAIIAFRQPISRVEVDSIRGVNSSGVLKNLLERNLVAIAGRSEGVGKPLLYGTTKEFLRYLGINDISDLPKPKEIEEIMGRLDATVESTDNIIEALTFLDKSPDEEVEEIEAEEPQPVEKSEGGNGKAE
jgi:segregation and condensation protein B